MRILVAVIGALACLVAAPIAQAGTTITFYTPAHAVVCAQWYLDGYLMCTTPNDGFTIFMYATGKVPRTGDGVLDSGMKNPLYGARGLGQFDGRSGALLQFGYHWSASTAGCGARPCVAVPDFNCVSASTGLTCRNRSGHGWWLGRYRGYRIF